MTPTVDSSDPNYGESFFLHRTFLKIGYLTNQSIFRPTNLVPLGTFTQYTPPPPLQTSPIKPVGVSHPNNVSEGGGGQAVVLVKQGSNERAVETSSYLRDEERMLVYNLCVTCTK